MPTGCPHLPASQDSAYLAEATGVRSMNVKETEGWDVLPASQLGATELPQPAAVATLIRVPGFSDTSTRALPCPALQSLAGAIRVIHITHIRQAGVTDRRRVNIVNESGPVCRQYRWPFGVHFQETEALAVEARRQPLWSHRRSRPMLTSLLEALMSIWGFIDSIPA